MIRAASPAVIAVCVALATFVAYLATLAPGLLGGDAGELQFVSPILSLTHPTGYPLLVLLNHLWAQLIPFGSVAWRLNVLNALTASLAVGTLVLLGHRLTRSSLAPVLGALFLAFSPIFWSQATGTDKYMLNALLLAGVLLLAVRWAEKPSDGRLATLALVYGLSLTNHRSMLLAAPALLAWLLAHGWRPVGGGRLLRPLALVLAPLALYAYVPWAGARGLPPGTWPVGTPADLMEFFLDRGYTSQIQIDGGSMSRIVELLHVSRLQLGLGGLMLGGFGLVALLLRDPRLVLLLGLVLLPNVLAAANYLLPSSYAMPRHWVFFIPIYLVWAIGIGTGIETLFRLARSKRLAPSLRRGLTAGVVVGVLGLGALVWVPAAVSQARAHRSAETLDGYRQDLQRGALADRFARLALTQAPRDAVIVSDWEQVTPLWYLQYVEGMRPDVLVRYPMERLEETLSEPALAQRSLLITRTLPGVEQRGVTSSVGPLIQLRSSGTAPDLAPMHRTDAAFGDRARLLGVTYLADALRPGSVLPLMLHWEALGAGRLDASVSVRLVSGTGEDVAQSDAPHPVQGTSPMSRWPMGAAISDYYELAVRNGLPPGEYGVEVIVYGPPDGRPLEIQGAGGAALPTRSKLPPVAVR